MQQALIHLATKGVNQREAAKLAGISEFHLSRELKKPQIQGFIAQRARQSMQIGVLKASNRLVELVDAESEQVAAKVAERILSSEGVLKSNQHQVAVSVDVKAGFVIDISEPVKPAMKVIDQ